MDTRALVAMAPAGYFDRNQRLVKNENYYAACGLLANLGVTCSDTNISKVLTFMNREKNGRGSN